MGYAGNVDPSYIIPSTIATAQKAKNTKFEIGDLDYYIGDEAMAKQKSH